MIVARPWRPENGNQAAAFIAAWCVGCERWRPPGRAPCPVMQLAAAHPIGHPNYPRALVRESRSPPRCDLYLEIGSPVDTVYDARQTFLF